MTHEPIHTVHLTPHITWQGTQAELEAMQKEGWPTLRQACKRDAADRGACELNLKPSWRRRWRRWCRS
jgi:hypothetical protein